MVKTTSLLKPYCHVSNLRGLEWSIIYWCSLIIWSCNVVILASIASGRLVALLYILIKRRKKMGVLWHVHIDFPNMHIALVPSLVTC